MSPFWRDGQRVDMEVSDEPASPERPLSGRPVRFRWRAIAHEVEEVSIHWRVHTNWWTDREAYRDYWEVATDTGYLCVLYRDLKDDIWYMERMFG